VLKYSVVTVGDPAPLVANVKITSQKNFPLNFLGFEPFGHSESLLPERRTKNWTSRAKRGSMLASLMPSGVWAPTPRAPRVNSGVLRGGSTAHEAQLPKWRTTMAKSHPVDETKGTVAVERTKRQRPNATYKSIKAKAPKRQTRSKSAHRSHGRAETRTDVHPD
jgi:hypothetical protein